MSTNRTNKSRPPRAVSTLPLTCGNCDKMHMSFECPPPLMSKKISQPSISSNEAKFRANGEKMFSATSRSNRFHRESTSREVNSSVSVNRDANNNSSYSRNRNCQKGNRYFGETHGHSRSAQNGSAPPQQQQRLFGHQQHNFSTASSSLPSSSCSRPTRLAPPLDRRLPRKPPVNPCSQGGLRSAILMSNPCQPNETKMMKTTSLLRPFLYGLDDMYEEQPLAEEQRSEMPMQPRDKMYMFETVQLCDADGVQVDVIKVSYEYTLGGPNDAILIFDIDDDF